MISIYILLAGLVLETAMFLLPAVWRLRNWLVYITMTSIVLGSLLIALKDWKLLSFAIICLSIFRLINMLRIVKNRMHEAYLLQATRRTAFWLGLVQLLCLIIGFKFESILYWSDNKTLYLLAVAQIIAALGLLVTTLINVLASKHRPLRQHFSDSELPTVTVAIPARNETADLEECLHSVLSSDYPKLEVIVLDDCSQDRTPEIIQAFAHDGVRFINGHEPSDRWLAKNEAYDSLLDQATGQYVLFCGVDVRFDSVTIKNLVSGIIANRLEMISIMPKRITDSAGASFIQPMRYWWELALPRKLFGRPPVLSSCWIIESKIIKGFGGFDSVARSILPEAHFARELAKKHKYRFERSSAEINITSTKSFRDQRETAIRMRYPQIHRRPELALAITAINLTILIGPYLLLVASLFRHNLLLATLSVASILFGVLTHTIIVFVSNPGNVKLAIVDYPIALLTEIVLGYMSMFSYEFSTVYWKGRNICLPIMHTTPHLPKFDA